MFICIAVHECIFVCERVYGTWAHKTVFWDLTAETLTHACSPHLEVVGVLGVLREEEDTALPFLGERRGEKMGVEWTPQSHHMAPILTILLVQNATLEWPYLGTAVVFILLCFWKIPDKVLSMLCMWLLYCERLTWISWLCILKDRCGSYGNTVLLRKQSKAIIQ